MVLQRTTKSTPRTIPKFHLISWYGIFLETHSFLRVLGDLLDTLRTLCVSALASLFPPVAALLLRLCTSVLMTKTSIEDDLLITITLQT